MDQLNVEQADSMFLTTSGVDTLGNCTSLRYVCYGRHATWSECRLQAR